MDPNDTNPTTTVLTTPTAVQAISTQAAGFNETLATPEEMHAYLSLLSQADGVGDGLADDLDPNKLVQKVVMSKDTDFLTIKLGDEVIDSAKYFYINIGTGFASRALFAPQGHAAAEKHKAPICSTGLVAISDVQQGNDKAKAGFLINSFFPTPYGLRDRDGNLLEHRVGEVVELECARCPFNRFESEASWDPSKANSKGKACKESRTYFVRVMEKVNNPPFKLKDGTEMYFFEHSPKWDTMLRLILTLGANKKVIDDMLMAATARRMPLNSMIIKASVKIVQDGQVKYAQFQYELVGFPAPSALAKRAEDAKWVEDYVKRNKRALENDTNTEAPW